MRCRLLLLSGLLIALLTPLCGCKEPPAPPEVQLAARQDQDLWRAGALRYAEADYAAYREALAAARRHDLRERARFAWWRDDDAVAAEFRTVLAQGERLRAAVAAAAAAEASVAASRLERLRAIQHRLRELAVDLGDSRLSGRRLARAEVELTQAARQLVAGTAGPALDRAESELRALVAQVRPLLTRFADPRQLRIWQEQVQRTLAETRRQGGMALVISKLDGELQVYRGERAMARFPVGFGFNLLSDKLHAGDKATPEGRYRVVRKNAHSRYRRALVLDYPNNEDRRRYRQAQRQGLIPPGTGIGSLIEIHGGGRQGLTNGCVALENADMERLFALVPEGTAVTIVGTLQRENPLVLVLRELP